MKKPRQTLSGAAFSWGEMTAQTSPVTGDRHCRPASRSHRKRRTHEGAEKPQQRQPTTIGIVLANFDVIKRGTQQLRQPKPCPRMQFEELAIRLLFSADPLVASLPGADALLATQAAASPASAVMSPAPGMVQQQLLAAPGSTDTTQKPRSGLRGCGGRSRGSAHWRSAETGGWIAHLGDRRRPGRLASDFGHAQGAARCHGGSNHQPRRPHRDPPRADLPGSENPEGPRW